MTPCLPTGRREIREPSCGCEPRPAKVEPGRPVASLAAAVATSRGPAPAAVPAVKRRGSAPCSLFPENVYCWGSGTLSCRTSCGTGGRHEGTRARAEEVACEIDSGTTHAPGLGALDAGEKLARIDRPCIMYTRMRCAVPGPTCRESLRSTGIREGSKPVGSRDD